MNEQLKSLDYLGREAKAVIDQADKAQTRANDLKITAGKLLLEAKIKIKDEGGKWLDFLKQYKLDERRSQEVMKIAKGETTSEIMKSDHAQRQAKYRKETKPQVSKSAGDADLLNNACNKIEDKPQVRLASIKIEGEQVEEIRTFISEAVPYDWDKDIRTQRLKADLLLANKKINGLADEIDELREPAKLCKQIKSYLQSESPQDWKGLVKMSGGKDW